VCATRSAGYSAWVDGSNAEGLKSISEIASRGKLLNLQILWTPLIRPFRLVSMLHAAEHHGSLGIGEEMGHRDTGMRLARKRSSVAGKTTQRSRCGSCGSQARRIPDDGGRFSAAGKKMSPALWISRNNWRVSIRISRPIRSIRTGRPRTLK
jgi:hypothetical protein